MDSATLPLIACTLAGFALVVALVALGFVLRSTPLKLLKRQSDLETSMEETLSASSRLEQQWTKFLVAQAEVSEEIQAGIETWNTKKRQVAARESKLRQREDREQGGANGLDPESMPMDEWERQMAARHR